MNQTIPTLTLTFQVPHVNLILKVLGEAKYTLSESQVANEIVKIIQAEGERFNESVKAAAEPPKIESVKKEKAS